MPCQKICSNHDNYIVPLLSALVQIVELNKGNLQMQQIEHFVKLLLTFIVVKLFLF